MKTCRRTATEGGFTLLEVLVSMSLTGILMAMVIGSVFLFQGGYATDVVRTRVNSNLRSAMDILSMNIRQAGENLQASFPAVIVEDGEGGAPDVLRVRRSLIPEVLTLCEDADSGDTTLIVSSSSLSNSECVVGNVAPLHEVFEELRAGAGGTLDIFIYNRVTREGEFLRYNDGGLNVSGYYLSGGAVSIDYERLNTSLYVIEEYAFQLDTDTDTLQVSINGEDEVLRAVAFSVTGFQVRAEMSDGATLDALDSAIDYDWKDIEQLRVMLAGEELYKGERVSAMITGEYFPRNVLSYDG